MENILLLNQKAHRKYTLLKLKESFRCFGLHEAKKYLKEISKIY